MIAEFPTTGSRALLQHCADRISALPERDQSGVIIVVVRRLATQHRDLYHFDRIVAELSVAGVYPAANALAYTNA
jgi:hypothetical protein